jgi:hypothetical protein
VKRVERGELKADPRNIRDLRLNGTSLAMPVAAESRITLIRQCNDNAVSNVGCCVAPPRNAVANCV